MAEDAAARAELIAKTGRMAALYDEYGWYFRIAAVALAAIAAMRLLRARKTCSLSGVRAEVTAVAATYAALYWLTSWLSRARP